MNLDGHVGAGVREARNLKGLSLKALSEKVTCGSQNIAFLERGEHRWTIGRLVELTDAIGADPLDIFSRALRAVRNDQRPVRSRRSA